MTDTITSMPTVTTPPDQDIRLAAIDPERSFAVSAPAGSGKTGLLTQRVLQLLAHCEQPEEILAITFTRKAAGEMQDRILHALWQAQDEPEPNDPHARRTWRLAQAALKRDSEFGWQLLHSPQRLRITTIDSLCRAITQQLPLASGLGAQPDTLEQPEQAYRLAVRELFKQLDKESPLREHLARLLRHLDNNLQTVEDLLANLLAKREQWLHPLLMARHQQARPYFEQVLQDLISEHLRLLRRALSYHASDLCALADRAATNLQDEGERKNRIHELLGITHLPPTEPEALPHWLALVDLLLTNGGTYRARLTKSEGFPTGKAGAELKEQFAGFIAVLREQNPDLETLLADTRLLPPVAYAPEQWALLESLTQLLPQLAAELMLVFKQLAATDYSAISQAALLALGDEDEPTDLALKLDYRIRHILVDEFQDTASPQLELLRKLTQGWQTGDGRTLFIVGDGMQSCYGFRNANVGLFLDARQQGIGNVALEAVDLCVNFRSQAGVVDWVNQVFAKAFPAQDDIARGAVHYSPSTAFKPLLANPAVQLHIAAYTSGDDEDDLQTGNTAGSIQQARQREAAQVVALVRQAKAENPQGSIAILVRTRTHLREILPALTTAGLNYQATEIDRLATRMAILDLRTLTRALLDPSDRISWLALLRAPWCGLTLNDMHALANTRLPESHTDNANDWPLLWPQILHHQQITSISADGHTRLEKLRQVLANAWENRLRKPLRQWIEGVWLALGGPACLVDANECDNVQSYLTLLDKHENAGRILDWQAFNQALQQLFAAPKADADPLLQVMTIHKSKGLEFDTVIIPGLERANRGDEKSLLLWQERINRQGERQLLLGSFAPIGKDKDPLYSFMRSEADKQQQFEATRLLYVGCTRAIKRLYLLGCAKQTEDGLQLSGKRSLLACIWPQVQDQCHLIEQEHQQQNLRTHPLPLLRLPSQWQAPPMDYTSPLASYRGRDFRSDPIANPRNLPELENRRNRLARHTGILIHRALQDWVERRLLPGGEDIHAYCACLYPLWNSSLHQRGWARDEIDQSLEKITRALSTTLNDPHGQWLLNPDHLDSQCELALVEHDTQGVREHIIDRTFIDGGERWILDYKSSEPEGGESVAAFVARERELYQGQLARYRELMANLESIPTRTALYFACLGRLEELS
ncbi:UvrD-helicase domain-containing protein [Cellvibrio japonicus]|uniref:DNA 3'-5' helicase n=1 Tax=Cellvibrio japonicus (strain Ueda107) TaxID=498211 RepID=B3PJ82_CELJU|nr:UvrD-helicase domain-containing protein [Cellvibrio japonicus]ACE84645.1 UvrD/REP helicase domain protein [Cellvibrio japonicus Ueda107]QEI12637.1 AAA family ATPase [Cellvibrio japonicus]QEI16211.1 AAA family ATPase [Cellvibrio japonicus]QEI19789.1 AAA family ATPase [Cellvibrio japonicus]